MTGATASAPTRFVQIGIAGIGVGTVGAVLLTLAAVRLHSVPTGIGAAVALLVAALLSTLTIEVGDDRVDWYFTGHALPGGIDYDAVDTFGAVRFGPLTLGYRIGRNVRKWAVSGGSGVSFTERGTGRELIVGSDRAAAVCAEITRRAARAGAHV